MGSAQWGQTPLLQQYAQTDRVTPQPLETKPRRRTTFSQVSELLDQPIRNRHNVRVL